MSLTAAAIRLMAERGLSAADIADIADAMEAPVPEMTLSPGAIRTRQWRERLEATGMTGEQWRLTSIRIIARDGNKCRYCGTGKGRMMCDHVTPLAQGGDSSDANLVCACHSCNGGKSGLTLEEWKGQSWASSWRAGDITRDITGDISHVRTSAQVVIPFSSSLRSEEVITPVTPNGVTAPRGAETARGTRLPDPWHPEEPDWSKAVEALGCLKAADEELDRFRDYWRAVPGAKGRKTDWPATWRNWVRRASETSTRKAHERPTADAKLDAKNANYARAWAGSERAAGREWEP